MNEPRGHQRVRDHVSQRVDGRDRDARLAEERLRLGRRQPREPLAQLPVEPRRRGDTPGVGGVLGPVEPGERGELRQRGPLRVAADGDVDIAVTGLKDSHGRKELVRVALPRDPLAQARREQDRRDQP